MRRDDQPFDLLVRIIGQREDDPGGLGARFERADLDAPHDAVRAGRCRDLDAVALRTVALDHLGEIDRLRLERHSDRLDGASRREPTGARQGKQKEGDEPTHDTLFMNERRDSPAQARHWKSWVDSHHVGNVIGKAWAP